MRAHVRVPVPARRRTVNVSCVLAGLTRWFPVKRRTNNREEYD